MQTSISNQPGRGIDRRTLLASLTAGLPGAGLAALGGCAASAPRPSAGPVARTGDEMAELSATDALALLRTGELSAENYAAQLLARQQRWAGLNAISHGNRDQALQNARAVDKARAAGRSMGDLAGLPLLVKDNIDTLGLPTSAGTPSLKNHYPKADAPVVHRLLAQGAVLLAKTNMHELAIGGTSSNPVFGAVRNPYDLRRVAGGSSGGTAAAIAARMGPAGLGSDTAGSCRIPASFSGCAGLRPTTAGGRGAYSIEGVVPLVLGFDTIGPMACTVADVALLDSAITGRAPAPVPKPSEVRLGIPRGFYWDDLEPQVLQTLQAALEKLRDAGVTLVEMDMGDLPQRGLAAWPILYASRFGLDFSEWLATAVPGLTLSEVVRQIASKDVKARFDPSPAVRPTAEAAARVRTQTLAQMHREYASLFQRHRIAALAFPTEPIIAPLIEEGGDRGDTMLEVNGRQVNRLQHITRNTRVTSVMGMPGLSLPAGLSAKGLPVGLELDGLPGTDATVLAVGISVERILGRLPAPQLPVS